ncbi:phosphoglycerate kinase [Candidatus Saccharibacteria bacterium]|nr:phosphoglycerate kinase [Candidatus Saccharibacteria bacterium]
MVEFRKKSVQDIDVSGKTVLIRVDYNVPMKDGAIQEDMRISSSLSTIRYVLDQGARKVILISHMGRPEGTFVPELSLAPCAQKLAELLPDKVVRFSDMIYGPDAKAAVDALPDGGVLLLENLRFVPDEEKNSVDFAKAIIAATGAEIFVQDGFAVIHRAHASTDAIARLLPAVAGFLVEQEVANLEAAMSNPQRPLLIIVGGAKVDDKQPLIDKFLTIADKIAVGGKIAADGYVNASPNVYVAEDFVRDGNGNRLDIGPVSTQKIVQMINESKTIIWNGTLGMVEDERYSHASLAVARAMGESHDMTIVGGGDTTSFVEKVLKTNGELTFNLISTGGGACLELLSGKKLPGLEVLQDK